MALILAVDDESSGLYFRKLILEHAGHSVLSTTGVEEALHLFRSQAVDLVVTDHLLGRQTGTEMAKEMKRMKPSVPIIVLSGTSTVPEPLDHADAFLSKTEGPEQLLSVVREMLTGNVPETTQIHGGAESLPLQVLLAAIVEDSDDAILSKSLDGTILTWNKAAERMYGYKAEEIIGKKVSKLLPPDRPGEVDQIMQRLRRGERLDHFETTRQTKQGRILNVSLTISPVHDGNGTIIAASTIARDTTQTKMAEEALRTSERLAVAGRMAATIAHEINNPLETVTNVIYLLSRNKTLDDQAREHLKIADDELRRIGQITRSTLGLYRERDTTPGPVDLREMIEAILSFYQRQIQSLGIKVEKRFDSVGKVVGVSGEIRQVFANLIANAIDALSISGTTLRFRMYDSADWRNPSRRGVRIVVMDDGPGMSSDTQANLFHPFFTTKGQKGTGLGLWVSRGIVLKHGGTLHIKSRTGPRHGSCFSIFFPRESKTL
ncbi:MAG TPA: PAS domain S-box protein [Terriglobales bacterium]|nr:PAS domain S-box protein [Terriglobales bacterium]